MVLDTVSLTVEMAIRSLRRHQPGAFKLWLTLTILLGAEFLHQTGVEWYKLITQDHLTVATNLFGTTYYSLVGLHASHVVIGLSLLTLLLIIALSGFNLGTQERRVELVS